MRDLCRYSSAVVEQLTCNQQVPSSTLGGGTRNPLDAMRPWSTADVVFDDWENHQRQGNLAHRNY